MYPATLPLLLFLVSIACQAADVDTSQDSVSDYAPITNIACPPSENLVREFTPETQSINPRELEYITAREQFVIPPAWEDWLNESGDTGYDIRAFHRYPRTGIAIPGGGLRAAQVRHAPVPRFH